MKNTCRTAYKHSFVLRKAVIGTLFISALLLSCSKDNETSNYTWLVSIDKEFTLQEAYIRALVDNAALSYPDVAVLSDYVGSGVDVFRIVYKTTVAGNDINASGLLCIPTVQGEYPVICCQNGTNTVDAYCPSNFANNIQYQLVEMLASTGFIVVIPDYPGFGASASVPHPYLIKEPTVTSITDMLRAVKELGQGGLPGITVLNEYYLAGYSQGGWATMALHKAIETEYSSEFSLAGSVCGAGPYDIEFLFESMINQTEYPMPVYICYIINAYSVYEQFTNPVTDILNEPYASRLPDLYDGTNDFDEINGQLTVSLSGLLNASFLSGFDTDETYATVREAMSANSVQPWQTLIPVYLIHGDADTDVDPLVTSHFYDDMIAAGTSVDVCIEEILPGLDHGDALIPAMIKGFTFIKNLEQGN